MLVKNPNKNRSFEPKPVNPPTSGDQGVNVMKDLFEGLMVVVAMALFFLMALLAGKVSGQGEPYELSSGRVYNLVAVVTAVKDEKQSDNVELVVSKIDEPGEHLFGFVSKQCFSTHVDGTFYRYLKMESENTCEWIP